MFIMLKDLCRLYVIMSSSSITRIYRREGALDPDVSQLPPQQSGRFNPAVERQQPRACSRPSGAMLPGSEDLNSPELKACVCMLMSTAT